MTRIMAVVATVIAMALMLTSCGDPRDTYEITPLAAQPDGDQPVQDITCMQEWPDFNADCTCDFEKNPDGTCNKNEEDRNGDCDCTLADYNGQNCTVASDGVSITLTCGDDVVIYDIPGECSVANNGDGTHTMTCSDGTTTTWSDGAVGPEGPQGPKGDKGDPGAAGTSCSVSTNTQGCAVVECTDGTQSDPICPGVDGQGCEPHTLPNACIYVKCGAQVSGVVCPGHDGANGIPGNDGESCSGAQDPDTLCVTVVCGTTVYTPVCPPEPCTVVNNSDGTFTMTCPDGTEVTWSDGEVGASGQGCEVSKDNGVCTMTCATTEVSWDCPQSVDYTDDDGDCEVVQLYTGTGTYWSRNDLCGGADHPWTYDDCDDDSSDSARLRYCYNATDGDVILRATTGCPGGYTLLFYTDDSILVNHGANEVFDGIDNDCDGMTDEDYCESDNDCDDDNPCTADACWDGICANADYADGTFCADALFCNGEETCQSGVCEAGDDPCNTAAGEVCDEQANVCEQVADSSRYDRDGDGYCASTTLPCVGSANSFWAVSDLLNGDCADDPNGPDPAVWCEHNESHTLQMVIAYEGMSYPACKTGYTELMKTSGQALINPGIHDTVNDKYDNDCDCPRDETGDTNHDGEICGPGDVNVDEPGASLCDSFPCAPEGDAIVCTPSCNFMSP